MQTVFATNPDFDSILLLDDNDRVLSAWQADAHMVRFYLANGMDALRWQTEIWMTEFNHGRYRDPGSVGDLTSIHGYGRECGRNGQITDASRRRFWKA